MTLLLPRARLTFEKWFSQTVLKFDRHAWVFIQTVKVLLGAETA